MTRRIDINRGWEFTERCDEDFLRGRAVPGLRTVELPHTCRVTPFDYFDESAYQMLCGYRRRLPARESWAGKRLFLHVGAAAHRARVFVDGAPVAEHRCGYTAFCVELTDAVREDGAALLAIEVDSRENQDFPPFGHVIDYMTYGGLYREVWLEVREPVCLTDVYIKPEAEPSSSRGTLTAEVAVSGPAEERFAVRLTLCRDGEPAAGPAVGAVADGRAEVFLDCGPVALWDIDSPALYTVRTELLRDGEPVDATLTRIGFRRAEFRADGFYLNGAKRKLVGLNRHQSYPYVGYAMPRSVQRFDAEVLKNELGVNAVRTSHYPQSHHFIDRCDELGLLVFTEIPGWQHIGGEAWKEQAVENTRDMVLQYRSHPSIILWGVRINESPDDDGLYARTNETARRLDGTRPTSGVRAHKKSSLLEDVYAYNDFLHDGRTPGCEDKSAVTPDMDKAYLVSEYNGHMFPTKTYDSEEHRLEHALRHAAVLDAVAARDDIAGSFGWCMADYNTHRDFGSGDRVCYHGVLDMFRNPKLAADVYAVRRDDAPVLSVSSSMDVGEHPASCRGRIFLFTNADAVDVYKNDRFLCRYTHARSPYRHLARGPIEADDLLGQTVLEDEGFAPRQAELVKRLLNYCARFGSAHLPPRMLLTAGWLMLRWRMSFSQAYALYGKYVGNWGDAATVYRFEAVKDGQVVRTVTKAPVTALRLEASASHTALREGATYDAALVRIAMRDQNGNVCPFYQGAVALSTEGPVELIGPAQAILRGGYGGTFVRTVGRAGTARLLLTAEGAEPAVIDFTIHPEEEHDAG